MAGCHACFLCFSYIKMGLMQENMCLLKNRSITTKPIIMNLSVNLQTVGNLVKTVISLLSKTFYLCFICAIRNLISVFAVVHGQKITKKARIEAAVLNSLTPISKAEICKILPDVSPTTVEAVLGAMVKSGTIKRIGSSRATRYIKV